MKTKIKVTAQLINKIMLATPFLMSLYAFLLFVIFPQEVGLSYWYPIRNIIVCVYFVLAGVKLLKKNKYSSISLKICAIGLLLSVFSWAIGGFIFDLIRVFQIYGEKIKLY